MNRGAAPSREVSAEPSVEKRQWGRVRNHRDFTLGLLLAALTFGVRVFHLSDAAMWEDEAFRFDLARGDRRHFDASHALPPKVYVHNPDDASAVMSIPQSLEFLKRESPYPPGYYLLLHGLQRLGVFQSSHLLLLNAFAAAVLGLCLYLFARRHLRAWSAASATLLLAFSPWDVGVCMQLKETGVAAMLGFASTLIFVSQPYLRWRSILSGLVLGFAVTTQQQSVYWGAIQLVFLGFARQQGSKRWLYGAQSWGLAVLVCLPWWAFAASTQLKHLQIVNRLFGGEWAGLGAVPTRVFEYVGTSVAPLVALEQARWIGAGLLATLIGVGGLLRKHPALGESRRALGEGVTIFGGAVSLAVITYIVMRQNQALWSRYSPLFLCGLWISVAAVLEMIAIAVRSKWDSICRVFVLSVVAVTVYSAFPSPFSPLLLDRYTDWGPVARALSPHVKAGDLIVHAPGAGAFDAFIHQWLVSGTHHMVASASEENRSEIVRGIQEPVVWLVLAWGQQGTLNRWSEALSKAGYVEFRAPFLPTYEYARSYPTIERGILMVGFKKATAM